MSIKESGSRLTTARRGTWGIEPRTFSLGRPKPWEYPAPNSFIDDWSIDWPRFYKVFQDLLNLWWGHYEFFFYLIDALTFYLLKLIFAIHGADFIFTLM